MFLVFWKINPLNPPEIEFPTRKSYTYAGYFARQSARSEYSSARATKFGYLQGIAFEGGSWLSLSTGQFHIKTCIGKGFQNFRMCFRFIYFTRDISAVCDFEIMFDPSKIEFAAGKSHKRAASFDRKRASAHYSSRKQLSLALYKVHQGHNRCKRVRDYAVHASEHRAPTPTFKETRGANRPTKHVGVAFLCESYLSSALTRYVFRIQKACQGKLCAARGEPSTR